MDISAEVAGFSLIILGALLLIGKWIRVYTPFLQNIFLPSSIIAGLLGLLLGPEILGKMNVKVFDEAGLFQRRC